MTTSQKSSATISAVPITRPPWLEDAIDGTGILAEERMEEIATSMPTLHDLYVLDNRLDAQLDALRVCGAHVWPSLSSLLAEPSPGLLFMATVLGIENRDTSRLKSLLSVAEAIPELQRSLQAALSWVNPTFTRPLVQPLLASNIPFYWRTALHLLHQDQTRADTVFEWALTQPDPDLQRIALNAVGDIGVMDLLPRCLSLLQSTDDDIRFLAARACVLLGERSQGLRVLKGFAATTCGQQQAALFLLTAVLPVSEAQQFLVDLAKHGCDARLLIRLAMDKPFIPALRFHALTRIYDPVVRVTTRELTIKRRLAEGLGDARRILDVGSGTGTLLGLLRSEHPSAEIVGLDADPNIIELAREKLGAGIQIVQGNATAPPFEPGSFDRVVSSLVFHHLTREQKSSALRAIREILVGGGELHLADWSAPHDPLMRFMFLGVQLLDGFETTRDNVRGDLPELVRAAGFQDVSETYRQRTPVLRVRLGEEVVVRLQNDLPQPTTIHWHGVRVPKAMDGVPGVTQDPIPPGGSFTYRFVPKDAGTFWFHPHVRSAEQVERGLYGVLIVDDAETLPYSRDEVWVLDDWRLGSDGQVDPRFVTRHDLAHDGRWGQMVTVNGDAARQLTVRPGERVRLRLVNTSNGRVYRPDFGSLEPRVIAVDGMYTARPLPLDGFELAPGNRLDLDIAIPADGSGRSYAITDRFTRRPFTLATIRFDGEPVSTPTFEAPSNPNVPGWDGAIERPVDVTYVLNAQRGGEHGIQWTINGRPWGEHEVTELEGGRWVRVRFQNDSARLHPMHIHGQFFKVIARNGQPVDAPYFRDTVLLRGRETIDVGMVPIDWGRWMMHCHILEHAESGMMTEVEVAPPRDPETP